jgi:3-oxoacyl-[acyl-carrier protein] reductase
MRLAGKTALVTGAGRGIGRAIASRLAADGARVIVNYSRSAEQAEALVAEIAGAGGQALAVRADIADLEQVERLFENIRQHVPALDILVNNAGRGSGGMPTLDTSTPQAFEDLFALNTRAPFFVAQLAARMFNDGGRIVNISSTVTRARVRGLSIYAGSKAALEAFTRIWAAELAPRQITVNCLLPGMIDTDLIRVNMPPDTVERIGKTIPLGRAGQPADIADVVAFLCSDDARWITGQEIVVSGGS